MNCVDITGRLRANIDNIFRYFEYELPYFDESKYGSTIIVTKFWTNQPNSRLNVIKEDSRVIIHGHLDKHDKFGTILIVEQIECLH